MMCANNKKQTGRVGVSPKVHHQAIDLSFDHSCLSVSTRGVWYLYIFICIEIFCSLETKWHQKKEGQGDRNEIVVSGRGKR